MGLARKICSGWNARIASPTLVQWTRLFDRCRGWAFSGEHQRGVKTASSRAMTITFLGPPLGRINRIFFCTLNKIRGKRVRIVKILS